MDDDSIENENMERLRNLPLRSEEIGYSPDEMLQCGRCKKPNAPTRSSCLYCGDPLEGGRPETRIDFHALELWESGFNVVITDARDADVDRAVTALKTLFAVEPALFRPVLEAGKILPVARVESKDHALIVSEALAEAGFETTIVADAELMASTPIVRLRGIKIDGGELVLEIFNTGENVDVRSTDLELIVEGRILEARTESIEKRKRGARKTLSESSTSADTPVIDLYTSGNSTGFRITPNGFDFSCLGAGKSLVAANNMRGVAASLRAIAPAAKFVDDYGDIRLLLELVWPSESRSDALGFQRSGFARKELSRVASTNNSLQLLRYSRLCRHLR